MFGIDIPFIGGGDNNPTIDPNLPQRLKSVSTKWNTLAPFTQSMSPDVLNAVFDLDRQRLLKGKAPLTTKESARALLAAQQGHPITPAPSRNPLNVIGNSIADVGDLARGIFKMPSVIAHDVADLPNIQQRINEGQGNYAERLLSAPGVRLIPGAYTARNIAGGHLREIVTHPVATALDILPGASKLAEGSRVAEEAARVASEAGTRPRPLKTVLTRRLATNDEGAVSIERNALGNVIKSAGGTRPGRLIRSMTGVEARNMARDLNYGTEAIKEALSPSGNLDDPRIAGGESIAQVVRNAVTDLHNQFPEASDSSIPEPDRTAWVAKQFDRYQLDEYSDASPRELLYASKLRDIEAAMADESVSRGYSKYGPTGELYDAKTADTLNAKNRRLRRARNMQSIRTAILDGVDPSEIPGLYTKADEVLAAPSTPGFGASVAKAGGRLRNAAEVAGQLSKSERSQQLSGIAHALEASGIDATDIHKTITRYRSNKTKTTLDDIGQAFAATRDNPQPLTLIPKAELLKTVDKVSREWGKGGQLREAIASDNWYRAKALAKEISKNKFDNIPEIDTMIASINKYARRDIVLEQMRQYTPGRVDLLERNFESAVSAEVPPKFIPKVQSKAKDLLVEKATVDATPEDAARITNLIMQHRFKEAGFTDKDVSDTVSGVAKTWREMQEAGARPGFLHNVSESQMQQLRHPVITEVPISPTQAKKRILDITPSQPVRDAVVSVSHQGLEVLRKIVAENFLENFRDRGILPTKQSLIDEFTPQAERMIQNGDPRVTSFQGALERLIRREYVPFEPEKHGFNWSSKRMSQLAEGDLYIPRYLADNLRRMYDPKYTTITAATDPIMRTFRTSVLAFSPRWQVGNIVGGGITTMLKTGPTLIGKLSEGYRLAKLAEAGEMGQLSDLHPDVRHSFSTHKTFYDEANYAVGRSLARVLQESRSPLANKVGEVLDSAPLQKVKTTAGTLAEKSYTFNQRIDMMYRISGYLYGHDKALTAGMSKEEAIRAGMELSRSVLPEWAAQTPIERTIFRSVMPFYSFASFIGRYALSYPIDHPYRAMVLNSLSQAELDDMKNGLPPSLSGTMFFGGTDSRGRKLGFEAGGLNPFKDAGNMFTIAGFLSGMNPLINTVLQQAGLKFGQAEAYPDLKYNPNTGKMEVRTPGLISSLATNIVPQVSVLTYITGRNSELNSLARTDPEAARRRLYQSLGLPTPVRRISIPGEIAKRELTLSDAASSAQTQALQSGGAMDSYASRFPSVAPILNKIRALQSAGQLGAFIPTSDAVNKLAPVPLGSNAQHQLSV